VPRPLPEAQLLLTGSNRIAVADSSGRFHMRGVAPGRHDILIRAVSFHAHRDTIVVSASAGAVIELGMEPMVLDGCPGFMVVVERKRVWRWPWQ
jgi:hypothetical protein